MGVLSGYAGAHGYTSTRWLGTSQTSIQTSNADLSFQMGKSPTPADMNSRYGGAVDDPTPPARAFGFLPGALQHGEPFSLPAQKGEPLHDLYMGGYLFAPGSGQSVKASDITIQDQEDLHFLHNSQGESLWSHLKKLHAQVFGIPDPKPSEPTWPDQRELVKELERQLEESREMSEHLVVEFEAQAQKISSILPARSGGQYALALRREIAFLQDIAEQLSSDLEY